MTPAARLAAAIAVLDRWLAGASAEQALTNWGRASRFAGSGDRQAVRDLVFDAIRCRRSFGHLGGTAGGGESGRALILGGLRAAGTDAAALFTGLGHAPAPLAPHEAAPPAPPADLVALDCPDWLAPALRDSLGDEFGAVMQALRQRAPVFLRANAARTSREGAAAALAGEGIATRPCALAKNALEVTGTARNIRNSAAYLGGLVELQDAASQAVVEALPVAPGDRVLDVCAGGGGKALALAARGARVTCHDADPARMRDLPARAARAGAAIDMARSPDTAAPYDLVLADAPCSGSGAWRRSPEGKWALTSDGLAALLALQRRILASAAALVRPGGHLAYATCSLLAAENEGQVGAFLAAHAGWHRTGGLRLTPLDGGDGFFLAILRRAD